MANRKKAAVAVLAPGAVPKVEKNVPIPEGSYSNAKRYPWDEMEVGDSFFIPIPAGTPHDRVQARIVASARTKCKRVTRRVMENGVDGIRAWKVAG